MRFSTGNPVRLKNRFRSVPNPRRVEEATKKLFASFHVVSLANARVSSVSGHKKNNSPDIIFIRVV